MNIRTNFSPLFLWKFWRIKGCRLQVWRWLIIDGSEESLLLYWSALSSFGLQFCCRVVLICFHGYLIIEPLRSSECFLATISIIVPEVRCRYSARTSECWSCRGQRWLASAWFNLGGSHTLFNSCSQVLHIANSLSTIVLNNFSFHSRVNPKKNAMHNDVFWREITKLMTQCVKLNSCSCFPSLR
jgi:hypothetical protein